MFLEVVAALTFCMVSGEPPVILQCSDTSVKCGVPQVDPVIDRIVGGYEATPDSWPWTVQLLFDYSQTCGGAIITESIIMTAAHCTTDELINPTRWTVAAGRHRLYKDNPGSAVRKVKQVIRHEDYNDRELLNDIALMVLEKPFNFSTQIKPVCLPPPSQEVEAGQTCVLAGWGLTEKTANPEVMNQVTLPIMEDDACSKQEWNGKDYYPNSTICAGYEKEGKDACQGDSGGPLVCKTDGKHWFAQGIVSWGEGCAESHKPGVYTDVTKFIPWIKHNVLRHGDCTQDKVVVG